MDKLSDFNDPIREYIINEILENYIYTNLLNEKAKLESKINKLDININKNEYEKYVKELSEINKNIIKIEDKKSKKYNNLIYRRFFNNINKANKLVTQNKESFNKLITNYVELLTVDDNESDKIIKHLEHVKNKLTSFISIVPDVSSSIDNSNTSNTSQDDNNSNKSVINEELDNIEKELDIMQYSKIGITPELKKEYEDRLKELKINDNNIIKSKANELLRKMKRISDKIEIKKNSTISDQSSESSDQSSDESNDGSKIGGEYNNYGFYKTTLNMIYGGADDDKDDLQKKFAEQEFESMNRNPEFKDNTLSPNLTSSPNITPSSNMTPSPFNEDNMEDDKDKEDKDKKKEEKDKKEKDKEEKEEKEDKEEKKEKKEKKEKNKKNKKKNNKAKVISDDSDSDSVENFISDEEKNKLLYQIQEIKNKLSINSKYITKYYEEPANGLISKTKELKNNLKEIDFFNTIKTKTRPDDFFSYVKDEIDKINKEIEFIDNTITNIIFNDSDGLLKSIDNVENNFNDFKKIISNEYGILKTVFNDDRNSRLESIHNIEADLSKLDNKFRTNINNYYQNIKDVQSILKNLVKKIENIINEGKTEYDKIKQNIEEKRRKQQEEIYNNQMSDYESMDRYGYEQREREERKNREKEKETEEKQLKELTNRYIEKIKDITKNDEYGIANINSKLNIEKSIFDNYKYNIYDSLFKKITSIENKLTNKKSDLDETSYTTQDGNEIIFNEIKNDNIFSRIWNKYVNNIKRNNKTKENIEDDFYDSVKVNDLNPEKVLEVTNTDKIIFIVLIFVIRQIALLVANFFIDSDIIKSFNGLIIAFIIIYIIILILIIILVNLDNYKMRILFNYVNLHINYYGISTHIFTFILFVVIIYMYIKNTDNNLVNDSNTKLSEEQKNDYKYKLSTISLIVYLFTCITDYLL